MQILLLFSNTHVDGMRPRHPRSGVYVFRGGSGLLPDGEGLACGSDLAPRSDECNSLAERTWDQSYVLYTDGAQLVAEQGGV
jgi:hypothetical protein